MIIEVSKLKLFALVNLTRSNNSNLSIPFTKKDVVMLLGLVGVGSDKCEP